MKRILTILFSFFSLLAGAQVTDNFSDGDFTASPAWSGDGTEFIINASQQLQLNNSVAGASYLSTASPGSSIDNFQWSFYIKQSFAPSGSNYGRVYLVSDQANLEGSLNGYYLQFGEAGSLDAVELFRQTGLASTSVCRGTNGEIAASFALGVKVTRDASGNWSLYVDPAGGTTYSLEASGTDLTYSASSFFGVACVYTVSSATKFYFDDFYNGAIIVDTTPPSITSSTVISVTQLDVLFSENVDLTTSQVLTNYSADNGLGNPTAAARDASNLSLVHLTWGTAFTGSLLNTLTVTNVQDLSGNAITSATTTFTYIAPVTPAYKDIILNEIFADPSPVIGLPGFEFVELYNRSPNTYDVNGWKFSDGTTTSTIGSFILAPGQYLILCPIADTASFTPYGNTKGLSSFPSLNNTGDNLKLLDNTLAAIDSVDYSDTWYQDAVKKNGGWTLELINPNLSASCPAVSNWIASVDPSGGTPGTVNSVFSSTPDVTSPTIASVTVVDSTHLTVCFSEALNPSQIGIAANYSISAGIGMPVSATANAALTCVDLVLSTALSTSATYTLSITSTGDCSGNPLTPASTSFSFYNVQPYDIVINEIMADPDPVVTILPDYEYVELYNRTAFPVNLNNWTFAAGTNVKVLPSLIVPADSFIVLTSLSGLAGMPSGINAYALASFPALTNTGQILTLRSPQGNVISTVSYTDDWYQDAAKKDGGWSLEQIDPANPCAGMSNWHASNSSNGGTPGFRNSVYAANPDHTPPQVVRVSVVANDTIQVYFNEPLDSASMLAAAIYTIDNGIGNPTFVNVIGPDFKSVRLALGSSLAVGTIYTITVNNAITDCVGNALGTDNSAKFAIPEQAMPGDIVINEILFDPRTPGVDFVEIYNRSGKVIDLKTMTLSQYDTVTNTIISPETISADGYLIFPGDYIVLSENGAVVRSQYSTPNPEGFIDMDNLPSMNIDKGTVCLSTSTDIIDNFKYYADMQFGLLTDTKGISLERIDFDRPTQDRTNWHSAAEAVGFATPAYKNSQYNDAGETESAIEITPEVFSPDEDGMNDVVNINYHFDTPGFTGNLTIYDSKGRVVKLLVRNELLGIKGTFSWDGIDDNREKARIGIYVIYFEVFDLNGNVKRYKKTCVLGGKL
ncbi:MAG: lamin tail domain-containing protein [Bacteroidia bacterium]